MSTLRKSFAIALMIAMSGAMADAEPQLAAKDIVIVHGALVDGSGWRAVHDILAKDGFHVTIVQEPLTGLTEDVEATRRVIDQQEGPVVLVGHSYGGSVITDAGADPKVSALVYVAALQPDAGETSGQLLSKFAAPNDAMRKTANRATPDKYFFIPPVRFHETYAADIGTGCSIPGGLAAATRRESFGGTRLRGSMANQTQLRHPDHSGSFGEPSASALDVSTLGRQGYRSERKPCCLFLPAGRGS
jgi:pimeloyl-ACP methyl ester carboxylesterase